MRLAFLTTLILRKILKDTIMNPISDLEMSNFVQDQGKQKIGWWDV
jgi:hypothetical protein